MSEESGSSPADGTPDNDSNPTGPSRIKRTRYGAAPADADSSSPSSPPPYAPRTPRPPRTTTPSMAPREPRSGPPYPPARGPRPPFGARPGARPGGPPHAPRPPRPQSGPRRLDILFEDSQLIAIDKPAFLPVIGRDEEPSVLESMRMQLNIRRLDRGPWTLHQIEESATGVVVLARTPAARDAMLKSRRFERYYLALVSGPPAEIDAPDHGTITSEQQGRDSSEVRNLVTHYQRLGFKNGVALLKLRPKTDARGQVDKHLHTLQARPVADKPFGASGLHLHEITLTHPTTGARLRVTSPPPAWMFERVGLTPPEGAKTSGGPAPSTKTESWDEVAGWYADLLSSSRNDLQTEVVWPGVMRLLEPVDGLRILDVACGEGSFARRLAARGASVTGIDSSPRLVDLATKMADPDQPQARFIVADAQAFEADTVGSFDAACSNLALMNIEDIGAVLQRIAAALEPGGRFVAVVLHPAFRSPRRTAWGWEGRDAESQKQFRRVDAYMTEGSIPIVMNPGAVAEGADPITTTTFVRPLQSYIQAFADAGLLIDTIEEWTSPRESEPGPRAAEENRARREFPMFLAIRAIRPTDSAR